MTFAELKQLVAELEAVERRADKYRAKAGRIEIATAEYNRLAAALGLTTADDVDSVELEIPGYVRMLDEYLAAACRGIISPAM